MNRISILSIAILSITLFSPAPAERKPDIVVAQDGSGQFTSIQQALDAVPAGNGKTVTIFIRKGTYHEKIYITKSHITLAGEDRDSTRIVYAELRKNWARDHGGSDWGAAVVNIDSSVTDITLANLTVHNNYGGLYGDHDHQFAIRGGGTRVILLNCSVIADGADTLSLWNKKDGMYYHAGCYFEGWVDYVCPRGWCYITGSRFYGHSLTASIWHDGDEDKDQKLVIRSSSFDGVPGFALGRNHRDGQMFLLDCTFSKAMADTPIYFPKTSKTPWQWGDRHYFYNCHRDGGDFPWFRNNLVKADGSPDESVITARWTFAGRWDPEETMQPVLSIVFLPRPCDNALDVRDSSLNLKWLPARDAVSHNVYFGKSDKPEFRGTTKASSFAPGALEPGTQYFWRIDEVTEKDTLRGPLWSFRTKRF
jgi:pectinesterase